MNRWDEAFKRAVSRAGDILARAENTLWVRRALLLAIALLAAVSLYLLNLHMPLILDDYDFMISWSTGEPLAGLGDVLKSQLVHYQIWGGRLLHVFTQSFLFLGKEVFNAANTAMFLLLMAEIYAIARPKRRGCWTLLAITYMVLMTMIPFFGTVFLWLTGSCIYLWGTVFALMPLVIERSVREGGFFSRGRVRAVVCFPLGVLAGWTNENMTCGMIAAVFVLMALMYMRNKRVPGRMIALWLGQCAGALLLLLAPGNFSRAASYSYDSLLVELIRRFAATTVYGIVYLGALLAAVILFGAGFREKVPRMGYALVLVFGALISVYAMVGSPELSDRTYTGPFILVLSALLVILGDAEAQSRRLNAAKMLVFPLFLVIAGYVSYHAVCDVRAFETAWSSRVSAIEEACAEGRTQVEIESLFTDSRFTMDVGLSRRADQWPNTSISKVYGIAVTGR